MSVVLLRSISLHYGGYDNHRSNDTIPQGTLVLSGSVSLHYGGYDNHRPNDTIPQGTPVLLEGASVVYNGFEQFGVAFPEESVKYGLIIRGR